VNPVSTNPTICASATAVGTVAPQPARLVIEAECTTCGPVCEETADGISIVRLAVAHSATTRHVVILNGTTDSPYADQPPVSP
jgi:hypothetical protein